MAKRPHRRLKGGSRKASRVAKARVASRVSKLRSGPAKTPAPLRRAVQVLIRSLESVGRASQEALSGLELVRQDARRAEEQRVVTALIERKLLDDLVDLETTLKRRGKPEELERLSAVPTAVLYWLSDALHLVPHLEPGAEREVPASAAPNYEWADGPVSGSGLLRLRVIAPGWKWRGTIVVRPRAVRIATMSRQ